MALTVSQSGRIAKRSRAAPRRGRAVSRLPAARGPSRGRRRVAAAPVRGSLLLGAAPLQALGLLDRVSVGGGLGRIGWQASLRARRRLGAPPPPRAPRFAHGAVTTFGDGVALIASYHPSQQNTFTGKLTRPMLRRIFTTARRLLAQGRRVTPRDRRGGGGGWGGGARERARRGPARARPLRARPPFRSAPPPGTLRWGG